MFVDKFVPIDFYFCRKEKDDDDEKIGRHGRSCIGGGGDNPRRGHDRRPMKRRPRIRIAMGDGVRRIDCVKPGKKSKIFLLREILTKA